MASYSWTAAAGGDWNTQADWTPGGVPGSADTASFDTGGNGYVVTGDGSAAAISIVADDVTFDGQLTTGALSASGDAYVDLDSNALVFDSGEVNFASGTNLEVDGTLITNSGFLDVAQVTGPDAFWSDGGIIVLNQLYVNSGGTFAGNNLTLNDGGSVTLDTSATFGGGSVSLMADGSLYLANAAGEATGSLGVSEAVTFDAPGGGGVLTLATDPGATLTLTGSILGAGVVYVNGGSVVLQGDSDYSRGTVVDSAALTLVGADAAGSTGDVFLSDGAFTSLADDAGGAGAYTVVGAGGSDTVYAAAGTAVVFAGNSTSLAFQGGTGASTVVGGAGVLTATGGSAGDLIYAGSSGQDVLTTGTGPATLVGGAGGMLNAVGGGADVLVAGAGNTTLNGGVSTGANLYFTSGTGTIVVEAGSGVSTVVAAGAFNAIYGSTGVQDDFLSGGVTQLDLVHGFGGGTLDVVGFAAGDSLALSGYVPGEAQADLAGAVVNSGNTIITLSDHTQVVLFGYTGLSSGSFT